MRRTVRPAAVLTAALAGLAVQAMLAGPVAAHPDVELAPTLPTDLTHARTDNVDYLGRFPEHTGTAGGALTPDRKTFVVTDPRGVHRYDVTDPTSPRLTGSLRLFQTGLGAALAQEDPDTDGRILLLDGSDNPATGAALTVVEVSKAVPTVLATLPVTDHTWTCVSGRAGRCSYAYGRSGHVVDLRTPSKPVLLDTTWRAAVGYGNRGNSPYTHDLTEIRPGLVMSAGSTVILMDTRNPARPVRLTAIDQEARFPSLGYHSAEWAKAGRSRWLVLGTEIAPDGATNTAGSDCQGEESVIETWDAGPVLKALAAYDKGVPAAKAFAKAAFRKVDAFDAASRGIFLTGAAPSHVLYCAHWMEQQPGFDTTGVVAISYYDRGTRFVRVDAKGAMTEIGWLTAAEGYSASPQWVTKDVVYVMDYRRGLEVLRLRDTPATRVVQADSLVHERATGVTLLGAPADAPLVAARRSTADALVPTSWVAAALAALTGAVVAVRRRNRRPLPA